MKVSNYVNHVKLIFFWEDSIDYSYIECIQVIPAQYFLWKVHWLFISRIHANFLDKFKFKQLRDKTYSGTSMWIKKIYEMRGNILHIGISLIVIQSSNYARQLRESPNLSFFRAHIILSKHVLIIHCSLIQNAEINIRILS